MIPKPSPFQPPRLATWLVDLFIPSEHAESVAGDLSEEFLELASKSGLIYARRWYWRQSMKTVWELGRAAFRAAPWLVLSTTVAGFLLLVFGVSLPETLIVAVLELRRHHVVPYLTQREMDAHIFWFNTGILTGRLLVSLFIGCIVALIAKAREMVATLTLSFVLFAWSVVAWFRFNMANHWPEVDLPLSILFTHYAGIILIPVGGVIVSKARRASRRWHSRV